MVDGSLRRGISLGIAGTALALIASLIPGGAVGPRDAHAAEAAPGHAVVAPKICNPDPPDYPGCTQDQINSWEVGTVEKTGKHYRQDRWGQAGYTWSNLGPAHDDKLRRLYRDAVDAFKQRSPKATPKYTTWSGAKAATECSAGGIWGGLYTLNCRFSQALDALIPDVSKVVIYCAGLSVLLTGAGVLLSLVAPESIPVTLVQGAILCAIERLWSKVWNGKRAKYSRQIQAAAIKAKLAVLGAIEDTPFGAVSRLSPERRLLAQLMRANRAPAA